GERVVGPRALIVRAPLLAAALDAGFRLRHRRALLAEGLLQALQEVVEVPEGEAVQAAPLRLQQALLVFLAVLDEERELRLLPLQVLHQGAEIGGRGVGADIRHFPQRLQWKLAHALLRYRGIVCGLIVSPAPCAAPPRCRPRRRAASCPAAGTLPCADGARAPRPSRGRCPPRRRRRSPGREFSGSANRASGSGA